MTMLFCYKIILKIKPFTKKQNLFTKVVPNFIQQSEKQLIKIGIMITSLKKRMVYYY